MQRILILAILLSIQFPCTAQEIKKNTGYASSTGVDIYFKVYGSGMPVLIINGGPGFNSNGFESLARSISNKGFKTILFDQRGTGKSTLTSIDESSITMDLMVKDIEAIREKLDIQEWVVLGHSFGGMLGGYYAAQHPEHVKGLILSSSGGLDLSLLNTAQADISARLNEEELDSLRYWSARSGEYAEKQRARYMAAAYVYNKKHIPLISKRLLQGNMEINGIVWSNLREMDYDVKDELTSFKNPVLILQGQQDIVRKELALSAKEVFKDSKVVFLPESGHYGWVDQPQLYYQYITEFLSRLDKLN